jgi:hypothetical protein
LLAQVAMGPDVGAWLQHIEKTLHPIALAVEVVVAAQAGCLASLSGHAVEQRLIEALQPGRGQRRYNRQRR